MLAEVPKRATCAPASEKRHFRVAKPQPTLRRSARLQKIEKALTARERKGRPQLPSPSSSPSPKPAKGKKRKQLEHSESLPQPSKRARVVQRTSTPPQEFEDQPILYWARTGKWPENYGKRGPRMSQEKSSKRRSSSTHHSDRMQRLAENDVHMRGSALLQRASKGYCDSLLEGSRVPAQYPCYPPEKAADVLERIHELNEFRLQRDVTPWVVPSAENLVFSGESTADWIGEEVQADWTRCTTMGGPRPKPDFAVGLRREAFTKDEIGKLQIYSTSERPFSFTPNLCFPFLMCEAKTGQQGMEIADRQNIHSGSIAVRAIVRLAEAAFGKDDPRVKELHGKVLAFTISHNNRVANLYGHYAAASDEAKDGLKFYRYDIAIFSLSMYDGRERYKAYNFVRNVYEKFAPEHLERIKAAAAFLPALGAGTGLSFVASELGLEDQGSQSDSQQVSQEGGYRMPKEPASTNRVREEMERKMEQQRKESKGETDKLLQQLERQQQEQQRQQQEQQRQLLEQLEQQRKESQEQLEQERKASKAREEASKAREERLERQLDKMMEMMSHVQPGRKSARQPS